uniref:Uncharacterized protein n=1 Tax=Oryza nivara TaxID=4536 RepID=A0A0E0I832_ORYNI
MAGGRALNRMLCLLGVCVINSTTPYGRIFQFGLAQLSLNKRAQPIGGPSPAQTILASPVPHSLPKSLHRNPPPPQPPPPPTSAAANPPPTRAFLAGAAASADVRCGPPLLLR